ncbi:MAG: hypothetical protein H0U56_15620 [Methylibium sp.]|nr:hypothetical protein [Methylibium sp.]
MRMQRGRVALAEETQLRRIVWVRAPSRIEATTRAGGTLQGTTEQDRIKYAYVRVEHVEAHLYAETEDAAELLLDQVLGVLADLLGPSVVPTGYTWVTETEEGAGIAVRQPKIRLDVTVRMPASKEVHPLIEATLQDHMCGITSTASDGVLWVLDNSASRIAAFSEAQIAASYAGAPLILSTLPQASTGVGHHIGFRENGDLLALFSEATGAESVSNPESLRPIAKHLLLASRNLTDIEAPRIGMPAAMGTSARCLVHVPGTDEVLIFSRFGKILRLSPGMLDGHLPHASAPVLIPGEVSTGIGYTHLPFDAFRDSLGNVWIPGTSSDVFQYFCQYAAADLSGPSGSILTPLRVFTGSNFQATWAIAFDTAGGCAYTDTAGGRILYFSGATLAAGSLTPSNPAPLYTWTHPDFADVYGAEFAADGALWVSVFGSPGFTAKILRFPASELASSGAKTPDRTISLPVGFGPITLRFARGHGAHYR